MRGALSESKIRLPESTDPNRHRGDRVMKEKYIATAKDCFSFAIAITALFGIGCAAVWGIQQIFRCIENILYAVLFFAAVALGGN